MNERRPGRETVHQDTALMQGNPQIQGLRDAVEAYFATCENGAPDQAKANRIVIQARTLPNGIPAADLTCFLLWFEEKYGGVDHGLFWIVQAYVLVASRRYEEADACAGKVLEISSIHRDALDVQIRVARAREDNRGALALAERACEAHPTLLLFQRHLADLLQEFGRYSEAADVLDRIASTQTSATPALAFNRIRVHFAAGHDTTVTALCQEFPRDIEGHSSWAQRLYMIALSAMDEERPLVASSLIALLLEFETLPLEVSQHLVGLAARADDLPVADRLREALVKGPDVEEYERTRVTGIAKKLCAEGQSKLATRYLRRCQRRWPEMDAFWRDGVQAALDCGALNMAETMIDELQKHRQAENCPTMLYLRGNTRTAAGRLEEAEQYLSQIDITSAAQVVLQRRLRILLVLGRTEEAEGIATELRKRLGDTARASKHFNVTLSGADLNECRVQRYVERSLPKDFSARQKQLAMARDFFLPASEIITDVLSGETFGKPLADAALIPRRILQYWDTRELPLEVADHVRTWQNVPGFEHVLLNERSAVSWLGSTFDLDHARAFRIAQQPAQKADFLRLCWIAHQGGIYADADDRLRGSLENVLNWANGALFFREPLRSIANNFMAARPGHPVLNRAKAWALKSLLSGENDRTWAKTGPGLLTRAVALTLKEEPQEVLDGDIRILPLHRLQTEISLTLPLPHKKTSRHWNAPLRKPKLKLETPPPEVLETFSRWIARNSTDPAKPVSLPIQTEIPYSIRLFPQGHGAERYKITGVAAKCDWVVTSDRAEPQTALFQNVETNMPRHIFLSLRNPEVALQHFANDILPGLVAPFVLVTGSEDVTLPRQLDNRWPVFERATQQAIEAIRAHKNLKHWFAENLDCIFDPAVSPLPTGFVFPEATRSTQLLPQEGLKLGDRPLRVLCVHRKGEGQHREKWRKVFDLARTSWANFTTVVDSELSEKEYVALLRTHSFVLCDDDGLDLSPQAWAAIREGAIPIVRYSASSAAHSDFPFVSVKEWSAEALDGSLLEAWRRQFIPDFDEGNRRSAVLEKMKLGHWWAQIEAAAETPGTNTSQPADEDEFVVICPGNMVSGGPEALHQLAHAIGENGRKASICYFPFDQSFTTPPAYSRYDVPVCTFDEIGDAQVVIPEARTGVANSFEATRVWIWWLSVGNFGGSSLSSTKEPERHLPINSLRPLRHLAQSEYARSFLLRHGIEPQVLGDYLSKEHLAPKGRAVRDRIVLYNGAKPGRLPEVAERMPNVQFEPLQGLSAAEVASRLRKARLYVDFGHHPGRDRLPGEAAMAGCCIITGRNGAASHSRDLPIPHRFKIDEDSIDFVECAAEAISEVLENYEAVSAEFDPFRKMVGKGKIEFQKQVTSIFGQVNANRNDRDDHAGYRRKNENAEG